MSDIVRRAHPAKLLWAATSGSRAHAAVSFVFMLGATAASFALPQAVRYVVDTVIGGAPPDGWGAIFAAARGVGTAEELIVCAALVVAISAIGGACDFASRRTLAAGAEGAAYRLRLRLCSHILALPWSWHLAIKTGDIIQRCTSDVEAVRGAVFVQCPEIVRTSALVAVAYAIMFSMDVRVAALSFLFIPIILVYSISFLSGAASRFEAADEAEGELLSIAQEDFTGVRVVRAFCLEPSESARFAAQCRRFSDLWVRLGSTLSTYWGMGDLITGLQLVSVCALGAYLASRGEMSAGTFIVFINYCAMTIWPVRGLGRVLSEAGKASAAIKRITEVLDAPAETDPEGAVRSVPGGLRGEIEFDRVSFSYGERRVLSDVSFVARAGETVGILGATGSGKSTIADLICRAFDVPDGCGRILVDGVDIRRYARAFIRENIGIVSQEPFLYSTSIERNIASLAHGSDIELVKSAAETAQIAREIEELADGYATVLGERGVTLSGGQRQRVAIARAIMRDRPITIFDDSLSAVDSETDLRIRRALKERDARGTVIIIAHRVSSVADADRIVILEGGRVAEQGTPAELLASGGIYASLCAAQLGSSEGGAR